MMPKVTVLDVRLYGEPVATLTNLQDGRTILAFNEDYIENDRRPTLSLSFKDPSAHITWWSNPSSRTCCLKDRYENTSPSVPA
jgi:hypothetical protein